MYDENKLNLMFDIKLYNGIIDLSEYIQKVEILSTKSFVMSMFSITLLIDSNEIFLNRIYGQTNFLLNITLTKENGIIFEQFNTTLTVLKMDFPANPRVVSYQEANKQEDIRVNYKLIKLICCQKDAYLSMFTVVNKVFENDNNLKPIDAVKELAEDFLTVKNIEIDDKNSNSNVLNQLMIPPSKFINAVRYIDSKYPLYKGNKNIYYYMPDNDTLSIWNLKTKLKGSYDYTIILLASGLDQDVPLNTAQTPGTEDQPVYLGIGDFNTSFNVNQKIMSTSFKNTFITHPEDTLFNTIDVSLDVIFNDNLLSNNNNSFIHNKDLEKLKKYNVLSPSNYEKELSQKVLSDKVTNLSSITINVYGGNSYFKKLMRPGVAVNVNCIRTLMINMTGQYIVNKSYLGFERYESKGHYYSLQCLVTLNRDFYE